MEFGDIERMVRRDGLEAALDRLAHAGVFVSLEEFRGRQPIRRGAFELPVDAGDFENPRARARELRLRFEVEDHAQARRLR